MELKTTNLNYNFDTETGKIIDISVSLSVIQERNNINAYILLEDDGTLEDLNKKQLTAKAIEKLKELIGE